MKYHSQDEGINFRERDEKWKPIWIYNVVRKEDGEDQQDRYCEKWRSIKNSQGGQNILQWQEGRLTGLVYLE